MTSIPRRTYGKSIPLFTLLCWRWQYLGFSNHIMVYVQKLQPKVKFKLFLQQQLLALIGKLRIILFIYLKTNTTFTSCLLSYPHLHIATLLLNPRSVSLSFSICIRMKLFAYSKCTSFRRKHTQTCNNESVYTWSNLRRCKFAIFISSSIRRLRDVWCMSGLKCDWQPCIVQI